MIRFQHLSIGYKGHPLFQPIDAELPEAQLVGLIGRNGTGKSSLLRAFTTRDTILSGSLSIDGHAVERTQAPEWAKLVAYVGTGKVRISHLRCQDLVAMGRAPYTGWTGSLRQQDRQKIGEALETVGMSAFADRPMDQLSDGECEKIMIARALAQDTPVLVLDEPTAFLDIPGRYRIISLLHDLAHQQRKTVLFSTHDLDTALEQCDQMMLIDPPAVVMQHPRTMVENGLLREVFKIDKY